MFHLVTRLGILRTNCEIMQLGPDVAPTNYSTQPKMRSLTRATSAAFGAAILLLATATTAQDIDPSEARPPSTEEAAETEAPEPAPTAEVDQEPVEAHDPPAALHAHGRRELPASGLGGS